MAEKLQDYFGWGKVLSLILAIIPLTSWILGTVIRFQEGKILAGLVRLFFGFSIIWLVDLIYMIMYGKIARLINM